MKIAPATLRTAWLYTRGGQSVTMAVDENPLGVSLIIRGPGPASTTYDFRDPAELDSFAQEMDRTFTGEGYQLQAVAERRSGTDRRQNRRTGTFDRRRA